VSAGDRNVNTETNSQKPNFINNNKIEDHEIFFTTLIFVNPNNCDLLNIKIGTRALQIDDDISIDDGLTLIKKKMRIVIS
jgi:hypothetical protein